MSETTQTISDWLMTKREVARVYSIHPKTVERWEADKKIPKRLASFPGKEPRWLHSVIMAHIQSMIDTERKSA
jgi:hypothetical protein